MKNVLSKVGLDVHKEKVLLALITPYFTSLKHSLGAIFTPEGKQLEHFPICHAAFCHNLNLKRSLELSVIYNILVVLRMHGNSSQIDYIHTNTE